MELRPFRAIRGNPSFKERRPGLWIDRQVIAENGGNVILPLLIGIVRLSEASGIELPEGTSPGESVSQRVGALVAAKADSEPSVLISRAPLASLLSTTRRPDFVVTEPSGVRHDFIRINDYAQHVDLQGAVKSVEAELVQGRELWEAGRQFASSPAAAKLP